MTNTQLRRIIQKIEVDKEGNVEIFLRLFGDLGLEEAVLIEDNYTAGTDAFDSNKSARAAKQKPHAQIDRTLDKTPLNNNYHT